jgi:hypothetical protein
MSWNSLCDQAGFELIEICLSPPASAVIKGVQAWLEYSYHILCPCLLIQKVKPFMIAVTTSMNRNPAIQLRLSPSLYFLIIFMFLALPLYSNGLDWGSQLLTSDVVV